MRHYVIENQYPVIGGLEDFNIPRCIQSKIEIASNRKMASEDGKKYARHVFRMMTIMHWVIVLGMFTTDGLAIRFSEGTSGYWGAGLAVAILMLFVSIQDVVVLCSVMNYEKDEYKKRKFIDMYNWLGLNIIMAMLSCIPGIAVSAAVGAQYGKDKKNATDSNGNPRDDYVEYVNEDENRICGILLAIFSGVTLIALIRAICWHGEIRGTLGIPEKQTEINKPQPAPAPVPAPSPAPATTPNPDNQGGAETAAGKNEIQLLKTQNNLLKEQNRIQTEQLTQMRILNEQFQNIAAQRARDSEPAPPEYGSLFTATLPPGVTVPDRGPPSSK